MYLNCAGVSDAADEFQKNADEFQQDAEEIVEDIEEAFESAADQAADRLAGAADQVQSAAQGAADSASNFVDSLQSELLMPDTDSCGRLALEQLVAALISSVFFIREQKLVLCYKYILLQCTILLCCYSLMFCEVTEQFGASACATAVNSPSASS